MSTDVSKKLSRKATPYVDGGGAAPLAGARRLATKSSSDGSLRTQAPAHHQASASSRVTRIVVGVPLAERKLLAARAKSTESAGGGAEPAEPPEAGATAIPCTTVAMRGEGFYNANCAPQREAVAKGVPYFVLAAESLPAELVSGRAVRIADYGSSQGRNSLLPVSAAVALLAPRAESVEVVHQDLPSNDFNSLLGLATGPDTSYARGRDNVFVSAKAGSFYTRLFPANSVTLGWSSIAAHWLSQPSPLRGALTNLHAAQPNAELQELARRDWATYISHREAELAPGGQLVQVEIANRRDESPEQSGRVRAFHAVYGALREAFGEEAAAGITAPVYNRTKEELLEPFGPRGASKLVVRDAVDVFPGDVFTEEFKRTGDAKLYADRVIGFFDAAVTPCLRLEQRFPAEQVRRFYAALRARVEASPLEHSVAFHVVVLRLEKPVA